MGRNDDGFNLDDMMEIFGDTAPAMMTARAVAPPPPSVPVAAAAPSRPPQPGPSAPAVQPAPSPARALPSAPPPASAPVPVPSSVANADLTDDEVALLKAYEETRKKRLLEEQAQRVREQLAVREQEARRIIQEYEREAAHPVAPAVRPLDDIGADENAAFCALLDETRVVMLSFLVPLIGVKAAANMLNKSVEKARTKAPVVLKDANWRMDGGLRDDGSVDPDRLAKNAAALPADTRVSDYLAGLRELVDLRLRAVEAGLGAGVCAELKARLQAARAGLERTAPAEWLEAFYSRVLA